MHPLLTADPWANLQRWYQDATDAGEPMPDAMALATLGTKGRPRVRFVLYKGIVEGKVAFVSNYESDKAQEIIQEPGVALAFHFRTLARQIRIEGAAVKLSPEASDAYFATRARESQLGAWASPQSRPISDRAELERRTQEVQARFGDGVVPRPAFWGGYGVEAERFEFWIGGDHRLHDRIVYEKSPSGWTMSRLAP